MKRREFLQGGASAVCILGPASAEGALASGTQETAPGSLKIACFQGRCFQDFDQNLSRVLETMDRCGQDGYDFLCFPEAYLSNYTAELAVPLDDSRIRALTEASLKHDMVSIVGVSEREGDLVFNTALVLYRGAVLGKYRKTMLTGSDKKVYAPDYTLPVFEAKGLTFGVIICHDSSFLEPAFTMRCKGARLLFSPHYNRIPADRMDEHRKKVRNTHVGLSTHLQMVVVRSNVVGWSEEGLGYGDSAIFSPLGELLAVAPLFQETVISARVDRTLLQREAWASRNEIPREVTDQLIQALFDKA